MRRFIFQTLALAIAISTSEAGAQVPSRRVSFGTYMAENQRILSHRRRPQVQVAFQETGPARSIASDSGGGIQLPSINSANPAPTPETPKGFSPPIPMHSAAPLAQPPKPPTSQPPVPQNIPAPDLSNLQPVAPPAAPIPSGGGN